MAKSSNSRPQSTKYKLIGKNYPTAGPGRQGHREGEIRRRLSRRRHAVLPSCC